LESDEGGGNVSLNSKKREGIRLGKDTSWYMIGNIWKNGAVPRGKRERAYLARRRGVNPKNNINPMKKKSVLEDFGENV